MSPETEVLRGKLRGTLYAPTDPSYDIARRGLGTTPVDDRFPALVVLPTESDDIARTLEFARTHGLEISVRSGGHDTLGASTTATGVVGLSEAAVAVVFFASLPLSLLGSPVAAVHAKAALAHTTAAREMIRLLRGCMTPPLQVMGVLGNGEDSTPEAPAGKGLENARRACG